MKHTTLSIQAVRLVLPYTPRPLQLYFHKQRTRFCVLLCHRRFGKTVAAVNDLLRQALRSRRADWRAAYMAPYLGQAKTVAWDYVRTFAGAIPGVKFNETELRCDLPNGARIRLFGTENADALRGMYLDDLVLDEPADMPREVWTRVLRPMLADRKGRALFTGTPCGTDNLLHDLWEQAGREIAGINNAKVSKHPLWSRFRYPASETGYIDADEIAAARTSMTEDDFAQEFECSFAAGVRGAYYSSDMERLDAAGRICSIDHDPALPVHTAWDLGMDDATAIWFFQVARDGWRMIDYYEASGEGLTHYARILQQRPYVYGTHIAPHDIRVRELGTGKSRQESAAALGIRFGVAPNLSLADGIHAVRMGLPKMWFDAGRCAHGLRALKAYRKRWRAREESFSGQPLHDWTSHAADALRYAVTGYTIPLDLTHAERRAKTEYNILGV